MSPHDNHPYICGDSDDAVYLDPTSVSAIIRRRLNFEHLADTAGSLQTTWPGHPPGSSSLSSYPNLWSFLLNPYRSLPIVGIFHHLESSTSRYSRRSCYDAFVQSEESSLFHQGKDRFR